MSIIVKKFGGTSLGSIDRIKWIAKHIFDHRREEDKIVVIVSAMSDTTNELFSLANQICSEPPQRELDMLLTAGERISMSLLSLSLYTYGIKAISFTGSQSGIITDSNHGNAQIVKVNPFRVSEELEKGKVVIVAGFQGVSKEKEITTLGRGGSDTTAVAMAGFLNADRCEIYTDVEGVYNADPALDKKAELLRIVDYDLMLHMSRNGAKVIHPRAVEFAKKYNIEIEIKSSFSFNQKGTIIKKVERMEETKSVIAVSSRENLLYINLISNLKQSYEILEKFYYLIDDYTLSDNNLSLLFDNKHELLIANYLSINILHDNYKIFGVFSVTITGYNLFESYDLIDKVRKSSEKYGAKILSIKKNLFGITVVLDNITQKKEVVLDLKSNICDSK